MAYIDGFIAPVPEDNRDKFLAHADSVDSLFLEFGARRVVETWAEDVPHGERTDFYRAVNATEGETVVFSWIEWADRPARDAAMAKMMADARMDVPMPFDGKRMIYGGFAPLLDQGGAAGAYVDGYVVPVPAANRDAYRALAEKAAPIFREYGATRVVEAWGDDIADGKVTDFKRAVQAADGEVPVFSWVEWPDKATRDAGWASFMADERMKRETGNDPFDGQRMFWGGFDKIFEKRAEKE